MIRHTSGVLRKLMKFATISAYQASSHYTLAATGEVLISVWYTAVLALGLLPCSPPCTSFPTLEGGMG
jgi:hypothetical protein